MWVIDKFFLLWSAVRVSLIIENGPKRNNKLKEIPGSDITVANTEFGKPKIS